MTSDEIESPICCKDCYERGRADALAEIEQREREAIYYAWDAHKHLRNPELEVSNEEIFQDYLEQQRKNHE